MRECTQEERIESLEKTAPEIEKRLTIVERDLNGAEGEFGIRKMTRILWSWYRRSKDTEGRRQVSRASVFQITLALIQSGILVMVLEKLYK